MRIFLFILFVAIFVFANSFYILAQNSVDLTDDIEENDELFTGPTLLHAIMFAYTTGIGDFNSDGFPGARDET